MKTLLKIAFVALVSLCLVTVLMIYDKAEHFELFKLLSIVLLIVFSVCTVIPASVMLFQMIKKTRCLIRVLKNDKSNLFVKIQEKSKMHE